MSVKLGRVVFRKIGGRIVPIRIGAEAKTIAAGISGVSKKLVKKANLLFSTRNFKVGSTGKLLKLPESDSTKAMLKFMDKTGAVRFSRSTDSTMIDISRKLSDSQKIKLAEVSKGEIYGDVNNPKKGYSLPTGPFKNFADAYRRLFIFAPKEIKKVDENLAKKAIKGLGTTSSANEAGFIMRDGRMIDLSGKKDGGPSGVRYLDHREVAQFINKRASKPSSRDVLNSLKDAQRERKRLAEKTHIVTNLKNDIKKIWPERKEFRDVIRSMVNDIRRNKRNK